MASVNLGENREQTDRSYQTAPDAAVDTVPGDLPVTKLLQHGAAGAAILHEASAGKHDLIVMGSRAVMFATPAGSEEWFHLVGTRSEKRSDARTPRLWTALPIGGRYRTPPG
jgi:hypothetical protein